MVRASSEERRRLAGRAILLPRRVQGTAIKRKKTGWA